MRLRGKRDCTVKLILILALVLAVAKSSGGWEYSC